MSDGTVRARLDELGLTLHGPHPPHDPLDAVVVHDGVARTSGQLPRIGGVLTCLGRLGDDVTVEEGREAAAVCALNALGRPGGRARLVGPGGAGPDRDGLRGLGARLPRPADGDRRRQRVLADVFGEAGRHTRSAIGVAALPRAGRSRSR